MAYTLSPGEISSFVKLALDEDAPFGDITSEACVDEDVRVNAVLVAKAPGVIAGTEFAREAFEQCAARCQVLIEVTVQYYVRRATFTHLLRGGYPGKG